LNEVAKSKTCKTYTLYTIGLLIKNLTDTFYSFHRNALALTVLNIFALYKITSCGTNDFPNKTFPFFRLLRVMAKYSLFIKKLSTCLILQSYKLCIYTYKSVLDLPPAITFTKAHVWTNYILTFMSSIAFI